MLCVEEELVRLVGQQAGELVKSNTYLNCNKNIMIIYIF